MYFILFLLFIPFLTLNGAQTKQATFIPPEGWLAADQKTLPKAVKFMVVGKGSHEPPPSINLGFEAYDKTLEDYLKIVKNINKAHGDTWKDLGPVTISEKQGNLSQVDVKTKWGIIRQMHLIYLEDGIVYILTAAALKDEFPKFYHAFFQSLLSFKLTESKGV